jgi:threonine dehydrogenase-like Zn-dependent dehydrogenase
MKALLVERKLARYAAAAVAGSLVPGSGARLGPLRLADVDTPHVDSPGWVLVRPRLAGICGSDLATVDGNSSRWFEPIVSFPFVPGHEVVGDLDDGRRVVIEPVLGCVARGITPLCAACASGNLGNCERIAFGSLEPGLQTGFCCDTGGGWSVGMAAHESQLHDVPDGMSDEAAVLVEPTACAVHIALAAAAKPDDVVVVLGAGALGLLTIAALAEYSKPTSLLVGAKHPQQREWAHVLGATQVVEPGELIRATRRATGSLALGTNSDLRLTGGAAVVIDCVGSPESLSEALAIVRPRGRVVLGGMPGVTTVDLTPLWQREVDLVGAYTYGTEALASGEHRRTFDLAFDLVAARDLGRLVTATYPLDRYRDAISHAAAAGARGAVKIAFDLRGERERNRL